MARMPQFADPHSYARFDGPTFEFPTIREVGGGSKGMQFLRLGAREGPLKYHWVFGNLAQGARSSEKSFGDFEAVAHHLIQAFVGVSVGGRLRFFHPFDQRLLRWDDQTLDIQEKDTANIEYEDSPIDDPRFEFWIAPTENFVPGFDAENVFSGTVPGRSIDVQVLFLAAKFEYTLVTRETEPEIWDKLTKFQIPSKYISFGGKA